MYVAFIWFPQDDFDDLDDVAKVNVHQSGAIKATPVKKE